MFWKLVFGIVINRSEMMQITQNSQYLKHPKKYKNYITCIDADSTWVLGIPDSALDLLYCPYDRKLGYVLPADLFKYLNVTIPAIMQESAILLDEILGMITLPGTDSKLESSVKQQQPPKRARWICYHLTAGTYLDETVEVHC